MADDLTTYDDFMAQQQRYAKSAHKRTQRSNRKTTKRCMGKVLIAFNVIFLVMGATMVGYGVHIHRSTENKLTQDAIAVGVISMGALFLILSTVGMCAVCLDSKCVITTYEVLLIVMAAAQIAVAVIVLAHSATAKDLISDAWRGANNNTRSDMQDYFDCCGLSNGVDLSVWPCPANSANTPCLNAIMDDLQANYSAVGWICVGVAFLQVIAAAIGCALLCHRGPTAEEALLLDDSRDTKRGRSNNKSGDGNFGATGWVSE